jgi:hypothetical protein
MSKGPPRQSEEVHQNLDEEKGGKRPTFEEFSRILLVLEV